MLIMKLTEVYWQVLSIRHVLQTKKNREEAGAKHMKEGWEEGEEEGH